MVFDEANRALQPVGINIWSASNIRRAIKSKLDDLILRQKTDDTHKKKSKIIEASLSWYKGELKSKVLSENPCNFEKALTKLKIGKLGPDGHHKVTYTVLFMDRTKR